MHNYINLTPRSKPVRSSGLVIKRDGDELVLRFSYKGTAFRLNEPAVLIWQLCDGSRCFRDVCSEVARISGNESSSVVNEVSEILSSLISKGLIELNKQAPNPILRISFIDYPEYFCIADNFFLNLFVNWFDLLIVDFEEAPELLVSWSSSEVRGVPDNVVVSCLVDEKCDQSTEMYDIVFRPSECHDGSGALTLNLPHDYILNSIPPLNETDRATLNSLFNIDAPQQGMPAVEQSVKKLTIGMATYDDYDGVYFSVQAIRMYHPEVTGDTEILVIDNNPGGACSKPLRDLEKVVAGYRYVAKDDVKGTSVRDFVFQEAESSCVMCIDSHVFIEPGAIRKLIDYFDRHPNSPDLLQGPLVYDDMKAYSTHFEPVWRNGMFGIWGCDERASDSDAQPFEIPMQGLGLAACRKEAWLGYNNRFSGFGGEEGYIHQKFRNAGARALCLPFLRWIHRFERPMGVPYNNSWENRVRNYLIGFEEVGLDTHQVIEHFSDRVNEETVKRVAMHVELERNNPFDYFDAIYCINLDSQKERWSAALKRFEKLGILYRVKRFSAIETPECHHIGCALSHRKVIEQAQKLGYKNVLVLEDDALFHDDTLTHLENAVSELEKVEWNAFYLGGMKWGEVHGDPYRKIKNCKYLEKPKLLTCTHAIAYNCDFYDTLLQDLPDDINRMKNWLVENIAIDQYLTKKEKMIVMTPVISMQPNILSSVDEVMRAGFS